MKTVMRLSWVLGMVAVAAGCSSTNVSVAANGSLSTYQASIGNLNTPNFALGDVVVLDPTTKQATKVASAQVQATDVTFTPTSSGVTEPFNASFDLSYSQKVQPYMKEEVASAVRGRTTLHVEQYFERKLTSPATFAARDGQLAQTLNKFRAFQPEAKFFLVSSLVPAQRVYFRYEDDGDAIHVGKYTFHVSYDQNGQLEQMSKERPAFFKLTPLTVDTRDGRAVAVVDKSFHENLPEYRVTNAVARTE